MPSPAEERAAAAAIVAVPAGPDSPPNGDGVGVVADAALRSPALVGDALPRVIRRIALPAVASNLLMTLFASMDAFWVGTRLGPAGLAAVSTSIFWVWVVISVAEGIALGLTALAARRHGERRPEDAAVAVGSALVFALALGAAIGIAGVLSIDALFRLMQTPPEVTALGRQYLGTYFLGLPFIFAYFCVDAAFRSSGDTRTPLVLLTVSVACTLILDPILIVGRFGFPRLGIGGAAIALLVTRGAASIVGIALLRRRGMLRFRVVEWGGVVRRVIRIGLPTAVTGVLFSLIYVGMTRTTTLFGTPALAALGLGHRVESWLYMIGVGFGAAAAAIVGQNLGARQVGRARRAGWLTLGFAMIPAALMCLASLTVPERMAALFTADAAVIAETARYLRINSLSQLLLPAEIVLEGALGGAGDTIPPMLTSTALTVLRIPLGAWAAMHWGTTGIWWVISITAAARGLAMMLLWRSGHWTRKSV
jgi:putative MATE family efflux protein